MNILSNLDNEEVRRLSALDRSKPTHLGWRTWSLRKRPSGEILLLSPIRFFLWETAEVVANYWSDDEAILGKAGIHAMRLPTDWSRADSKYVENMPPGQVVGLVERFDRYVLGEYGWRAERVRIRALRVTRYMKYGFIEQLADHYQVPVYYNNKIFYPTPSLDALDNQITYATQA